MSIARDLLLNDANDLVLTALGDFALIYDGPAIAQNCRIALDTFTGEVFYDITAGTQWMMLLANKQASQQDFQREIRRVLLAIPGVKDVQDITITVDSSRIGTIACFVTTDTNELLPIVATPQLAG